MKLNNKIGLENEVSDLLINKEFLWALKDFLSQWVILGSENLPKEAWEFLDNFTSCNLEDESCEYTKEQLLKNIWTIFSVPIVLNSFLDFIDNDKIDLKEYQLHSEVLDYLFSIYNNSLRYKDDLTYVENELRTKVKNIIPREVNDIRLKLVQKGFPQFTDEQIPIVWAEFTDYIDVAKWAEPDVFVFLKIKDYVWKECYINREGSLLKDNDKKLITEIEYHFYFWDVLVLKYTNEDMETKLELTNTDSFASFDNWFTDWRVWKLEDEDRVLDYLYLSKKDDEEWWVASWIFNKDINRVNALDIYNFISNWNFVDPKVLDILKGVEICKIWTLHTFSWIKFIELEVELGNGEIMDCVLQENWKVLFYQENNQSQTSYVDHLEDEYAFIWRDFVWFGLTSYWLDGHIDAKWNVVKIRNELLVSLKKSMETKNETYYILNWNSKKLISELEVIRELELYTGFDEHKDNLAVELFFENKDEFYYEDVMLKWVKWKINDEWKIEVSLIKSDFSKIDVSYKKFISIFDQNKNYKRVLTEFNTQIKKLEAYT